MRRTRRRTPQTDEPRTLLDLYVQPGAAHTEVVGWHGDAIKIRVAAPPVAGEANQAITRYLAGRLGIRPSRVELVGGARSRRKRVAVHSLDRETVLTTLGVD